MACVAPAVTVISRVGVVAAAVQSLDLADTAWRSGRHAGHRRVLVQAFGHAAPT
jgi:hypothetical protein